MKAERHCVQYGEHRIKFSIVRRDRTTLEIAVEPDAAVVVAAPLETSLAAIEEKVRKRAAWIRRQQRYFTQFFPRTPDRQYVAGETHLYLGRQYRLKVVPHVQATVKLVRGFIVVQTHTPDRIEVTRELVENWYRGRAHAKFAERLGPVDKRDSQIMGFLIQGCFSGGILGARRFDRGRMGDHWGAIAARKRPLGTSRPR